MTMNQALQADKWERGIQANCSMIRLIRPDVMGFTSQRDVVERRRN